MHFRKALNSVLQPSHRFKPTASSKKGKANTAAYEEKGLVTYINKYSERTSGNFRMLKHVKYFITLHFTTSHKTYCVFFRSSFAGYG